MGESPHRVAKREQIVEVAIRLFAERGYRATTVEDIMETLGTTGAAFYYYFSGKESVLATIFDEAMSQVEQELALTLDMKLRPAETLERMIATHTRVIGERPYLSTVLFHDSRELSRELAEQVRGREQRYTEAVRTIYREGVEQGIFVDEDPELVVNALLGMANWIYRWYRDGRHPEPKVIGDLFGHLAMRSVAIRRPRQRSA